VNSSSLSGVGAARLAAGEKIHHIRRSRLPDVLASLAFMLSYDVPLLTSGVVRLLPREQAMRRACRDAYCCESGRCTGSHCGLPCASAVDPPARSCRGHVATPVPERMHDRVSESGVGRIEESGSGHGVSRIFDVLPVDHLAIDACH